MAESISRADFKGPQPVSVEDWDDEAQSSVPGTRTVASANVAVKRGLNSDSDLSPSLVHSTYDGTDSGYVSKAPSMASSGRRRKSELKLETAFQIERERKPYAMTAAPVTAPNKIAKEEPKPVKKPFCHKEGLCWVCDQYGFHFDPKAPPKELIKAHIAKPMTVTKAPTKIAGTKPVVNATPGSRVEEQPRPPSRRLSSNQARPASMYVNTPIQQPSYPQYPVGHSGWPVAATPTGVVYSQYAYVTTPATPGGYVAPQTANYYSFEPQQYYEDYSHPPLQTAARRTSVKNHERPILEKRPSRSNTLIERAPSRAERPQIALHKSNRSIDADKIAMPPPPKPQPSTGPVNRPRPSRSQTEVPVRTSRYEEDTDSESDDEQELDLRAVTTSRQPPSSPRRPPSSYKPPNPDQERPSIGTKSKSYDSGTGLVQIAKTQRTENLPRRRTTESVPSSTMEAKEAAAEAYMRKRGSLPVNDLTAENLQNLRNVPPRQAGDQRSESGSTHSHVTLQSSSKDSSTGRGRVQSGQMVPSHSRGTSMSINVNGVNLAITDGGASNGDATPIRLDVAGVQISMNNKDKENIDFYKRPPKQLERTPSMSRPSRRSLTQSLVSAATTGSRRENDVLTIESGRESREYSRRSSRVDEEEREILRTLSQKSSRQASRNASTVRQAEEAPTRPKGPSHRSSVDYSQYDEPVM